MNQLDLKGTFAATYTPFNADGSIDEPAYRALCERLVEAGVGLVPCGTTGETPTLSADEYAFCVSTAVEVNAGRFPVIAGTGSNSTAAAIANTRQAKELGADVALVVTPYYNKPPQKSLIAHYTKVADEGGLPVVMYNVPGRTGCNMLAPTTLALAEHDNILAVKEASGDLGQIEQIALHAPDGFRVMSGDDALTMALIMVGGHGVISVAADVAPVQMKALVDAALEGDFAAARAHQAKLLPLFSALFCTSNPIPLKRAAAMLGQSGPETRLPLTADACDEAMVGQIRAALVTAGVLA